MSPAFPGPGRDTRPRGETPGPGARHPAPGPSQTGTREAFAGLGGCASGLIFGYATIETPPRVDPEASYRHLVEHPFDRVPGFGFGVVIGRNSLA